MHCKPGEAYTRLKTASCEAGWGECTCVHWKSVYGVYKFLTMLIDAPLITQYLLSQSVIRTLTLRSIYSYPAKDRTTIPRITLSLIQILKMSSTRI